MRSRFALILAVLAAVLGGLLLVDGDREDAGKASTDGAGAARASTGADGTTGASGATGPGGSNGAGESGAATRPGTSDARRAPASGPPRAQVRDCADRAQGTIRLQPDRARDTIIGPLAILAAAESYRNFAKRPDRELQSLPGIGMPAMKLLAWLPAGQRVTLVVPRRQRPWLRLIYGNPPARAWHAVTLQACRPATTRRARLEECRWRPYGACAWGQTTFAGGIGVDFANAPRRGLCARLIAWVEGLERPLSERVFRPGPGRCARNTS